MGRTALGDRDRVSIWSQRKICLLTGIILSPFRGKTGQVCLRSSSTYWYFLGLLPPLPHTSAECAAAAWAHLRVAPAALGGQENRGKQEVWAACCAVNHILCLRPDVLVISASIREIKADSLVSLQAGASSCPSQFSLEPLRGDMLPHQEPYSRSFLRSAPASADLGAQLARTRSLWDNSAHFNTADYRQLQGG